MQHETPSALPETAEDIEDISGFVGMAARIMDHKGRISFPRETCEFTFNGQRTPDAFALTPFAIRSARGNMHVYLIPHEFRRQRFSSYPNSVCRYPDITIDRVGRILLNTFLQKIVGKPGGKIFIGFGPYCALMPSQQKTAQERLKLPEEILEQLLRPEIFNKLHSPSYTVAPHEIIKTLVASTRQQLQKGAEPVYIAVIGDTGKIQIRGMLRVLRRT